MNIDDRPLDEANTDDGQFDARLRAHYAQAGDALSPRTRAQLLLRRQEAMRSRTPVRAHPLGWPRLAIPLAAACAVGVLALGLQWRHSTPDRAPVAAAPDVAAPAYVEDVTALDESPEFYVWLASGDAQALAME